jgi:hypothetical protein
MKKKIEMIPVRYIPSSLTKRDREKQKKGLRNSRKMYKRGIYVSRKPVSSFRSKKSQHILNAERIYNIPNLSINSSLSRKTGCSQEALSAIVKKGEGAFYSSGSRPNQTPQSWGIARMASAITSGKAAAVDYNILEKGCQPGSKALQLAKESLKKNRRKTKKIRI